jgi:threonine dehydratase
VTTGRIRAFRTLFISDVHLGTKGCQADRLLDFLRHYDADTIYLVGDIVDGWQLRSSWYWPQAHNDVVQKLLRQARKGARIVYVPGNHDEFLRDYYGVHFGGVEVVEHAIHAAGDGRRYLVVHGDHFDLVVTQARWLALLGSKAYDIAIAINRIFNALRRRLGFYWSLSQWAKLKVKNAVNYIGEFERTLAEEARHRGADGVICGHIHHAVIHDDFGIRYVNCGDWVESCSAVVEHFDGRLEVVHWTDDLRKRKSNEVPTSPADEHDAEICRLSALARRGVAALPCAPMQPSPNPALPTAADVDTAAQRLAGVALRTPLVSSPVLDALTGARVFLKAETLQRTGSFKFRGAYNKLSSIPQAERAGGVVAFSSGNHAQGVAAAAQILGMRAVIVMPADAPRPKRERTAALGAEIVLYDRVREDRQAIARAIAEKRNAALVPPYDDPLVIAGQGTAGREIVEDLAAHGLVPDVVAVTASGGGLTAGIALAVKARSPQARVYTAEPEGFDDHARSFRSGQRERNSAVTGTICDALMAQTPGELTFAINRVLVGEGTAVSDQEVAAAVAFAFHELKLVVEPGGAAALAALLSRKIDVKGKIAVAVLSGGNVDPELFHRLVA